MNKYFFFTILALLLIVPVSYAVIYINVGNTSSGGGGGSTSPGGVNTSIQFNNNGVLGGSPNATINPSTGVVTFLSDTNFGDPFGSHIKSQSGSLSGYFYLDEYWSLSAIGDIFTTANIGISVNPALAKLHIVSGDTTIARFESVNMVDEYGGITISNPLNAQVMLQNDANVKMFTVFSSNNQNPAEGFFDYGVYNDQILETAFIIKGDTNNVGIGTMTPEARLDISGLLSTDPAVRIRNIDDQIYPIQAALDVGFSDIQRLVLGSASSTFGSPYNNKGYFLSEGNSAGLDLMTSAITEPIMFSPNQTTVLSINTTKIKADVPIKLKVYTVATLPTGTVGDIAFVNNSLAPTFGAAVVGGGAVVVPVYHDGTSWKVG